MNPHNFKKVFFLFAIIIQLLFLGCKDKEKEKEQMILDFNAKEIDFEKYKFTIDLQEEIYDKTIFFKAKLADIYIENGKLYYMLLNLESNLTIFFKLESENKKSLEGLDYAADVIAVAHITGFDFYQMDREINTQEDWWIYPNFSM